MEQGLILGLDLPKPKPDCARLFPWLRTLGDQRAEVLAQLMRLMAEGVLAPHSGVLPI